MAQEAARVKKPEQNKELIALRGEVASLRESSRRLEVGRYLDKLMASSDHSPEFLKAFREALGKPKSVDHVRETWAIFTAAAKATLAEGDAEGSEDVPFLEASSGRFRESGAEVIDFKDCVR